MVVWCGSLPPQKPTSYSPPREPVRPGQNRKQPPLSTPLPGQQHNGIRSPQLPLRVANMLKYKRTDDRTIESTKCNKKQKTCTTEHRDLVDAFEEQFGDLHDSHQGVWGRISEGIASNLSQSVVSVASFKGGTMICSCSGIVILCKPLVTTVLTSASLLRSYDESKVDDDFMIKVRDGRNQYSFGRMGHHDLDHDILLVNIQTPPLSVARLYHEVQLESGSKVVAVGRVFNSRRLMATSGLVKGARSISDQQEFTISTCKISKIGTGGPLIDLDGNFHGMNFYGDEETRFLSRRIILEFLKGVGLSRVGNMQGAYCTSKEMAIPTDETVDDSSTSCVFPQEFVDMIHEDAKSCGYPLPTTVCEGMYMINSFEEKFRSLDFSGEDSLDELSPELAKKLSLSVVSLASFNGKTRWFACSGVLIEYCQRTSVLTSASLVRSSQDESKIDDTLQIEVRLPNKQRVKGTLQCFCLHHNIAIVNITEFPAFRATTLHHQMQCKCGSKVVGVGRLFTAGILTATFGTVADKKSKLGCDELMISTCKITKAGIGGPLVDFDGNFVGMNFYDADETPFLPRHTIVECLKQLERRTISVEEHCQIRWPVPKPYWYYPTPFDKRLGLADLVHQHTQLLH